MKRLSLIVVTLLIAALFTGALAETYRFDGAVPSIAAVSAANGAPVTVTPEKLSVLGLDDDGAVVCYAENMVLIVRQDELNRVSTRLTEGDLPVLSEVQPIQRGGGRNGVETLQRALSLLGYLSGSVDGSFGGQTERAVAAFQADRGLEETGIADAITQRLAYALAGSERVIGLQGSAGGADQFAQIADRTEDNLEPLMDQGLSFEYDDIAGTGFITNGSTVTLSSNAASADLNSYSFVLRFGFNVAESNGVVTVKPAIKITNTSVRRPIMQNMLLKSGDSRVTIKASSVSSTVSGSKSVETGLIKLNDDGVALIAQCAEAGELKLRITGKYDTYDVTVPQDRLEGIAAIGRMAQEMNPPEEEAAAN